jgi:hypothetical protein
MLKFVVRAALRLRQSLVAAAACKSISSQIDSKSLSQQSAVQQTLTV